VKDKRLFEEFPPVSAKEWTDKISSDLKGADFVRKLVWKTKEGFDVMPFYRKEDLEGILMPDGSAMKDNNRWFIRQDINVSDWTVANREALSLMKKGIDSAGFIIGDPSSVNEDNMRKLLEGIDPRSLEMNFLSEGMAREIVACLRDIFGSSLPDLRGCIEADPLGRLMTNGTLCIPEDKGFDYLALLTKDTLPFPGLRNIRVSGRNYKDAGSDSVTELAFSLSMGVEYLDQLIRRGLSASEAAGKISFCFGTGPDYFIEIAKLRAARILWSLILERFMPGESSMPPMRIHSVTTAWNSTVYDPYVNMLRTQGEAMSAVIGGTDSLTILPFDNAFSSGGEFPGRIARNQQLILKEEAFFDKVADPSAGSYYIENLTSLMAEKTWQLFIETEKAGGFLSCLKSGVIQEKILSISARRRSDISRRKEVLVGTSKYPDPDERITPDAVPLFSKGGPGESVDLPVRPVKSSRAAEEIEKIRIAVEKARVRPEVFLLTIGNPVFAKARAQFTAGFFGCAGYRIIDNEVFRTPEDGTKAAMESGAGIVVICSSDEEYAQVAPGIFRSLGGHAVVVIAGNPESAGELQAAGITNFISIRSDLCETLNYYNRILGIN